MSSRCQTRERLAILEDGREVSHLSLHLDEPRDSDGPSTPFCVLYMHGFASSQAGEKVEFFRQHFLERGLAFCSFDFQGHGESGGAMLDLTLSRNVEDIRLAHRFLTTRGYPQVLLFGSSMGGGSALWYAALHPEDVVATISIAPALDMGRTLLDGIGPRAAERWKRKGRLEIPHALGLVELGWGLIEDVEAFPIARLAELYAAPALIFQGKNDQSVGWRGALDLTVTCAYEGIELHLMADGDHRLIDRLDHLWRLTASFLEARDLG